MGDHAHEFDFWIGEWDVAGPDGASYGRNSITSPFGNGVLAEHWRGTGGVEGHSLNVYDEPRARWHQTWVDTGGNLLLLEGGPVDGAMVLEGVTPDDEQRPVAAADHLDTERRRQRGAPALGDVHRRRRLGDRVRRPLPPAMSPTCPAGLLCHG